MVKILTYNIWFNETFDERLDAVLEIIEQADADFICLQEMTQATYAYFMQSAYISGVLQNGGSVSPATFASYGTIIVSKYSCHFFES